MPEEVRVWRVDEADELVECPRSSLDAEERLESWLEDDITMLDPNLMVIGRQVQTDFGGVIDLLCIEPSGDLAIIELKRRKTPREVTAQVLDYAAFVDGLTAERVAVIAASHLGPDTTLEEGFESRFHVALPDSINENHRMLVVASQIDASSERIIRYLSDGHGVDINAVTFQFFRDPDGRELVARSYLIEPSEVEYRSRTIGGSKRLPNLRPEELEEIADENGAGEMYRRLVAGMAERFQKHTTRSSMCFTGSLEGSQRAILSLVPGKSSGDSGLYFQVYLPRFRRHLGIDEESALAMLPSGRQEWKYYEAADPEYSGFEGYFVSVEDVEGFLGGLKTAS